MEQMMQSTYRRWPHLLGVVVLSVVLAACGGSRAHGDEVAANAPSGQAQQAGDANSSATAVNVVATNFHFALDAAQASAGTITFLVTNNGNMPHDFAIQGNGVDRKTAMIQPGQSASLTVDLKPGTYTYFCTVPGHALLGMRGVFAVN
jgi:plastocyanin